MGRTVKRGRGRPRKYVRPPLTLRESEERRNASLRKQQLQVARRKAVKNDKAGARTTELLLTGVVSGRQAQGALGLPYARESITQAKEAREMAGAVAWPGVPAAVGAVVDAPRQSLRLERTAALNGDLLVSEALKRPLMQNFQPKATLTMSNGQFVNNPALTWGPDVVRWPQNNWVDGGSHKVPAASAPEELGDARFKKPKKPKKGEGGAGTPGRVFKKQLSLHLATVRPGCIRRPHARGHRAVYGASWKEKGLKAHMETGGVCRAIPPISCTICVVCATGSLRIPPMPWHSAWQRPQARGTTGPCRCRADVRQPGGPSGPGMRRPDL